MLSAGVRGVKVLVGMYYSNSTGNSTNSGSGSNGSGSDSISSSGSAVSQTGISGGSSSGSSGGSSATDSPKGVLNTLELKVGALLYAKVVNVLLRTNKTIEAELLMKTIQAKNLTRTYTNLTTVSPIECSSFFTFFSSHNSMKFCPLFRFTIVEIHRSLF